VSFSFRRKLAAHKDFIDGDWFMMEKFVDMRSFGALILNCQFSDDVRHVLIFLPPIVGDHYVQILKAVLDHLAQFNQVKENPRREDLPMGTFLLMAFRWLTELLYLPCLVVISRHVNDFCYRLMFFVGVADVGSASQWWHLGLDLKLFLIKNCLTSSRQP